MKKIILISLISFAVAAQQPVERFKGQEPIRPVNTASRPITPLWKGIYKVGRISLSTDFKGARINHARLEHENHLILNILPENQPINSSAWYAFSIWSDRQETLKITLEYPENVNHRYDPKISSDKVKWQAQGGTVEKNQFHFSLPISKEPLFVASQPLITSDEVNAWIKRLDASEAEIAGKSTLQNDVPVVHIGKRSNKNKIVILGRQHPPEVTGHLALEAFVETLTGNDRQIEKLRSNFHILVFPLINPDGVDGGHWRHNQGGVDLNRDWSDFNQPETQVIRDYLRKNISDTDKLYFAIDFHSTHDDIYYVVDPKLKGNAPGLVNRWLTDLKNKIDGYDPNIKPLYFAPPTSTAFSYLFETYGAESLVYEIGDKTSHEFIEKKSKIAAISLAELLNNLEK